MSLTGETAPDFELPSTNGEAVTLSDTIDDGPAVVLINRGSWCSFCGEQLQTFSEVSYDLWFNHDVDVLPVVVDPLGKVTEMRDRYDLSIQLLADPDGAVAERYSGTERTSYGVSGIGATYVIDGEGVIRFEDVSDHAADRVYGNWVRYFVDNGLEDPYAE